VVAEYWSNPQTRTFGELLIDLEDRVAIKFREE